MYGLEALVPNVTTYCITGYGVPTFGSLDYGSKSLKEAQVTPVQEIMTDGDNCVPVESLRICDRFAEFQEMPVHPYHMEGQVRSVFVLSRVARPLILSDSLLFFLFSLLLQTHAGLITEFETLVLFAKVLLGDL